MLVYTYRGVRPRLGEGVFLAPSPVVAGAIVLPSQTVPAGQLVVGVPARVARSLTQEERSEIREISQRYLEVEKNYQEELGPGW